MVQINPKEKILDALSNGESLTVEEIADLTDLPIGHCTMTLNRLVAIGLISRKSEGSYSLLPQ